MARRTLTLLCAGLAVAALAACGGDDSGDGGASTTAPKPTGTTLGLSSSAFLNGSRIPARYTCDGQDESPPLTWTRVPVRARSLALVVEDLDAPGGVFLHWSVYDVARGATGVAPGSVPRGAAQGVNSFGHDRYDGPCPPQGAGDHRYVFRLSALDDPIGLEPGASPEDVRSAIDAHAIASGTLTGLYRR